MDGEEKCSLAIKKNEDKKLKEKGWLDGGSIEPAHLTRDRAKDKTITESISARSPDSDAERDEGNWPIWNHRTNSFARQRESRGKAANPHPRIGRLKQLVHGTRAVTIFLS